MFERTDIERGSSVERLATRGYWPARAAALLAEGRYSTVVEICRDCLEDEPHLVSGRLIYARALFHAGQTGSAAEQFYRVLSLDPDNLVALKYLGDIRFADGDEYSAMAHYRRILEIDPGCRELVSLIEIPRSQKTQTVTLRRAAETAPVSDRAALREIPFFTETVGDLYLAQGHHRLAAEVFRSLYEKNHSPRLMEKLARAEKRTSTKEK